MTILHTDRLTLTPVQLNDLDDLIALWGDPAFATAIFPAPLTSIETRRAPPFLRRVHASGPLPLRGAVPRAAQQPSPGAGVGGHAPRRALARVAPRIIR